MHKVSNKPDPGKALPGAAGGNGAAPDCCRSLLSRRISRPASTGVHISVLSSPKASGLIRSTLFPTGKNRHFECFTGPVHGLRTPTNERTVPNVKFHLFGTIGAKFTVKPGRYRRQQTVFSTRLGFVHRHRFVCHRRCGSGNGFSSGNAMGDLTL